MIYPDFETFLTTFVTTVLIQASPQTYGEESYKSYKTDFFLGPFFSAIPARSIISLFDIQTQHLRRLSQRTGKTFVVVYIICYYISDLYFHFIMLKLYYNLTNLCTF